MACSDCGAKKGHLDGCPQKTGNKAGGPPPKDPPRQRTGRVTPKSCLQTNEDGAKAKHDGLAHVCMEPNAHSGQHRCILCGKQWKG